MNIVLYTRDMEPITVIDLPMWALEHGERLGFVRLAMMDPPLGFMGSGEPIAAIESLKRRTVTLEFQPIRLHDKRSWLITVDDEVLALNLKPSWLPGQRGTINGYERTARTLSHMLIDVLARGARGY